ncbi:MAG: hypothetical protein Q8R92_04240 [Deltaproteobacteria bacterium]|nr:hypothetical protein [Deltaproteobacteria bacterium]
MRAMLKTSLIVLAVGLALTFAYGDAYAAGCCQNQSPSNGQGQDDDLNSGPLPDPGCTTEPAASPDCYRFDNLQEFWNDSICTGSDPDGAGPATGDSCLENADCTDSGVPAACCTGSGTGTCGVTDSEPAFVPALSTWGVLLFLMLGGGLILLRRSRSGMSGV